MNKEKIIYNNRLKDFMTQYKMTNRTFAEKYNHSESSVRDYKSGKTKLPYETAFKIAEEYNISVDWLYCRNSFMNERDTMTEILLALYKIFRTKRVQRKMKDGSLYTETELYIDDNFREYLYDIQQLEYKNIKNEFDDEEEYQKARSKVQATYREYLKNIFNLDCFNKEASTKISSLNVLDDTVIPAFKIDTQDTD